jgi:hypothetical protein
MGNGLHGGGAAVDTGGDATCNAGGDLAADFISSNFF